MLFTQQFNVLRRLPPWNHHPLTIRIRQEAGIKLLCSKCRGAAQVCGRPKGINRRSDGDGTDTHRV